MICPKCQFENPPGSGFCNRCGTQIDLSKDIPYSQRETIQQPKEELTIGSTFAGRYQIIEELGRGGMGNVYKVLDKELGEKVALKLLKPEIAADHRIIERFRNELRFARKITHKNVCRMFDLSKAERTPYITMEYVSGEDLKSTLRRVGPLSEGKALYIARQVCDGLIEAHKLGVVHRDMKPQNIMIDKQGYPHIMDFGIARSMSGKGLTTSGIMIGTPEYMSPEQVEGKEVDQRADIYAMGVILYEMVTGTTPFKGETAISIAIKHTREKPRNPREINDQISVDLSRLILKCMEKDRNKRYQNVQELLEVLNKISEGIPTTDRVIPEKPTISRTLAGKPGLKRILIPTFTIVALIIAVVIVWRFTPLPEIIGISPSTPEPSPIKDYMNSANQFWKEKNYSNAFDQFKKILELDPENFDAQFGLANSLKAQDKLDEAIPEYEKAIAMNEKDHRPYGQLGLIYEQKKEWKKALSFYKRYLNTAPQGNDFVLVSQKVINLENQIQIASAKPKPLPASKKEPEESQPSKKAPSKKVEAEPEPVKPEEKKPDISGKLNEGVNALSRGEFDECIKLMEEVIKLDPGNSSAEFFLAEAKKRKENKRVEQEINTRLKSAQDAFQKGNYQECINRAEEVLTLAPKNSPALSLISDAKKKLEEQSLEQEIKDGLKNAQDAFQKGNYQECVNQAEEVLTLAPGNSSALNLITDAKKKLEEQRIEQEIKDGLITAQESFDNAKYQECIDQAKKVLNLDPENAQAKRLINQSTIKLAPQQAKALVDEYIHSINTKSLLTFYESACLPQLYEGLKKTTEIIMNRYESFQSIASDINIQFKGLSQAEISFSHILTGVSKDGVKQVLFEGFINWELTRQDENWKITNIIPNPRGKK